MGVRMGWLLVLPSLVVLLSLSWGSTLIWADRVADEGQAEYGLLGSEAEGKTRLAEAGVFRAGTAGRTGEAAEVMLTVVKKVWLEWDGWFAEAGGFELTSEVQG